LAGCYVWYSKEGTGRGHSPLSPLIAVPNVTVHQSTASVPITVLLYNGPLLCSFNVPIIRVKQCRVFISHNKSRRTGESSSGGAALILHEIAPGHIPINPL